MQRKEGAFGSLFLLWYCRKHVIDKSKIESIINASWDKPDIFVTEIKVSGNNDIQVFIDGDKGVNIDDCIALSRLVESSLDREEEDFSLDVMTHGVTESLLMPRQYFKNVGRQIEIKTVNNEIFNGELKHADDNKITVYFTFKERIEGKKKKVLVENNLEIPYDQIASGIIKVSFK